METKEQIRKQILSLRDAISPEEKAEMDRCRLDLIRSWERYRSAERVWLYASFRSEADTVDILSDLFATGKAAALPRVLDKGIMEYYQVHSREDLTDGAYHIPEPDVKGCRHLTLSENGPDLVLVPGAVFDMAGHRIGYGGGYYDRYFSQKGPNRNGGEAPVLAALCYECQLQEEIPHEAHDIRMDVIITERRIITCR